MAKSKLDLIISAVDEASGTFNKIGAAAKTGLAIGLGAAVAGASALALALGDCVKAAMEAEEVQAQLNAVLASTKGVSGMTAESVNAIATELSQVTRFEDDTIVKSEALLLTFTKIGKDIFPQATEAILNVSTAMGTDLQSATTMVGKALNDPIAGMTALTRAGVQFTAAQKEQIKTLVESGNLLGAQKIILGELETQFGGVARAAGDTLAGKLDILKNNFGNIKEEVGARLIPVLTELLDKYGPQLIEIVTVVATWLIEKLVPALIDVCTWLGTNLPPAIETAKKVIDTIVTTFNNVKQAITEFLAKNGEVAPGMLLVQAAGEKLAPVFNTIQAAIDSVKNAIQPLMDAFNALKNFLAGLNLPNPLAGITLPGALPSGGGAGGSGATEGINVNAAGTPNFGGGLTWVGERGPELVGLPRGSRIYSNPDSRRMAGNSFTININAPGSDPQAVAVAAQTGVWSALRAAGMA